MLFLYQTEEPLDGASRYPVNGLVAKQRNGPKGRFELAFRPQTASFENVRNNSQQGK